MAFLPADFEVPTLLETDRFRLRPISVDDLDMDYLRWHEEEFQRRSSLGYAVWPPTSPACSAVSPSTRPHPGGDARPTPVVC
jgi:hypothetical protein